MASNYKSLKCDCCAGALEYSKEKKVWVCQYCGNEIRREEEYDGLYTIKNVVKQTITDVAYGRLDVAGKNLAECEKIDSRYVGTVIARLCVQMFTLTTPGACPQGAAKSLIAQMKRGYGELTAIDSGISTEEEALYEAFEGAGDPFAVLVLVYDSLGDTVHRDFVEKMMNPSEVYAADINENLLRYAMRNHKLALADSILDNVDNIPCKNGLSITLSDYPDGDVKRGHIRKLVSPADLIPDDRKLIEKYLKESADSLETKECAYRESAAAGAAASIEYVIEYLLERLDGQDEKIEGIIRQICAAKPNDAQLYYLVERIFAEHSGKTALTELKTMAEEEIYLAISAKHLVSILNRKDVGPEEKTAILEIVHHWKIDARTHDSVLADYLNSNQDDGETRMKILACLISYVTTISTAAMTQYVLKCTTDGERKPEVLQMLLGLELNLSFFRELLQNYMRESADDADTKNRIITMLSEAGLQVDSSTLVEMALAAKEEMVQETAAFIQKMIQSGVRIQNDALSTYLEKADNHRYYAVFINLLHCGSSIISAEALCNYVLYARMDESVKVQNILTFAGQCARPFGSADCTVVHLGHHIRCNLLQAYVLTSGDSETAAQTLVNAMKQAQTKLNPPIQVDGMQMKFKKYIVDNRQALGSLTEKLCTDNKVFSLLF